MAPSPPPPPSASARELRYSNRSAGVPAVAPKPKSTSRKRQQSNADESAKKRTKTGTTEGGDAAEDIEEEFDGQKGATKGKKAKKTGGKSKKTYLFYFILFIFYFNPTTPPVERHGLIVKMKMISRMPKALLPTSSRVYSDFYFYIYFKIIITNIIYFRVERQVVAAGTSVAPPERPSHSQKASFLPPPPTVSSSRARVNREPKITATKEATPSVDEDASSDSGNDCSKDYSDTNSGSGTDDDSDGDSYTKPSATPIRRGPPSRSQPKQHNEPVMATAETSDHGILDVEMHSPPHAQPSGRGRGRNVKPIGSSSRSQTVKSSGASRPYGGTIGGKAVGNAPNIADFNAAEDDSSSINVEGTVNLFPSSTRPTTLDIDETAVIAVTIPFEGDLAPLLKHIAKYYSSMSGKYFKFY